MKLLLKTMSAIIGISIFCFFFPLFHIVPLQKKLDQGSTTTFNPQEFTEKFWNTRLLPDIEQAPDAQEVLTALKTDLKSAKAKYGKTFGISDAFGIKLQGLAHIIAKDSKSIQLSLDEKNAAADLQINPRVVIGNSIRDATGLLDVNQFANSQDFNAVSTMLNKKVETEILPLLDKAVIGQKVNFVAVTTINSDSSLKFPIKVIPIKIQLQEHSERP